MLFGGGGGMLTDVCGGDVIIVSALVIVSGIAAVGCFHLEVCLYMAKMALFAVGFCAVFTFTLIVGWMSVIMYNVKVFFLI